MSDARAKDQQNRGGFFGRGGPVGGLIMPVQKAKDFKGTLKRLASYLLPQKYALLAVIITAVISTIFTIVSPKILGDATTIIFQGLMQKIKGVPGAGVDFSAIMHILIILGILYVISAIFNFIQQYIMASVAQKTTYELRKQVDEKLTRLPLKFFDSRTHGEIMSRAVNDMDNISSTLQQSLTQLIMSIVTLVGVVVMMLSINLLLTIVVLLTLPLSLFVTTVIAKRSQGYFMQQQSSLGELNGHVEEMFTGHKIVKAFGHEGKAVARFDELNGTLYDAGWKAQFVSGIIMPLMMFIGNIGYVLVSIIGCLLVTQRAIQIGDVQAFIQYARQFSQPITQLANIANIIQSTVASAERVFELLDEEEEIPDPATAKIIEAPQGDVQFEHVKFGYKDDAILIEDMNINVKSGQMIAIVGPTGAGKTTLVNLLMRFYELNGGKILIDGVETTQLRRGDLRRMFGMVLQDTWLFSGTIRENIAYGRAGATEEEIIQAATAAHADHFIRTLPAGYDTVLNEEASNISQGQKQLLTIARAILADPAVMILDEATSSVDTRTEVFIQEAMNELTKGRTSFVIAHRLSTIRNADLILVMNHGSIIEQGTHSGLLAKGGFYADLYNSQFTSSVLQENAM
ncbi:ABC transporter ATP-binding protein [Ktedonosporobacter rubrisoli]|uniref:ABC transporter ATP-binding protein n=1 Tax=Ktedonosporobacter rubrisoli TaxID=2509675 RepID=A0A4P6JXJ0_KTERU|nr:ABC transporter ATP-binding protein [Ktedonosporobacter rubrisoli]QBD80354.1 ABC transporter ATP-binding protein [Ktedonosporobacter rubrisoli]